MLRELRIYYTFPRKLFRLIDRFERHTLKLWKNLGIKSIGFWTTVIGDDNNTLYYMLEWNNLSEREKKWGEIRAATENNKLIIEKIYSQILSPTNFSKL